MVSKFSEQELASRIQNFAMQKVSCLFAGAGVGQQAGLPSWKKYLQHLADVARKYEKETAALMVKRIETCLLYSSPSPRD